MKLYESKPISRKQQISENKEPKIYSTASPIQESSNAVPVIKSTKRQLETDDDTEIEEPSKKPQANWITPPEEQELPDDNEQL